MNPIDNAMKRYGIVSLLSTISAIAVLCYLDKPASSITLLMLPFFFKAWILFPRSKSKRFYIYNGVFSLLFALSTAIGRKLDFDLPIRGGNLFLLTLGLFCAFYPIISIITKKLESYKAKGSENKSFRQLCFLFISLSWLAGYLAVFPGIYTNDAPFWYRCFSDSACPITADYSLVYMGFFYVFVRGGKVFFDNYECGLAVFIAIQSIFILWGIYKILSFVQNIMGNRACLFTTLFFSVVPTHMLMAMQTAQGAPFMVCFAMVIIHLYRMITENDDYWSNFKNIGLFILWGIGACILRNNAYYIFVLFLVSILFYIKQTRVCVTVLAVIVFMTIYKGPLLGFIGISKGNDLRESLSMPLQQMACAYVQYPHKMMEEQKTLLEKYIPAKALRKYTSNSGISDVQKGNLNVKLVRESFRDFINLYISIGLKVPVAYLKAAYMQDLGLLYIDKRYQDGRIWHNYIEYISYDLRNPVYINIKRYSLFPLYDKLLGKLFGEKINKDIRYWGDAGDTKVIFSSIPIFSVFCRCSTYFWCLVYFLFFAKYKNYKEDFLYLSMVACFTLSVMFAPVVLYRYFAPVIFVFPVIIAALFGERKRKDK